MVFRMRRVGQTTLRNLKDNKMYKSYVVCKDEGRLIVLVTEDEFLKDYPEEYINVVERVRRSEYQAYIDATVQGKPSPTDSDRYKDDHKRLYILKDQIPEDSVMDIYHI